ncbi:MAG TPA: DNA polymerase I [bacterium]|nr:DNA polymerase I [bacterium]
MPARTGRHLLVLIDANGLVYRAFYALPYFTTSDGQPTNAVYGFTTMLLKVLEEESPEYVAVAFDKPGPTFRHEAYAEYKATRRKMPDDLRPQVGLAKEVVDALQLPVFEVAGFEADDVIGALARQAEAQGIDVLIVTGDLDALQLVSPHTRVMMTSRGITETTIYDEAAVRERFGIAPQQIPDLKSLKGDTTDNIPGVPGVGEKTASRLLGQYGSVEALLNGVGDIREAKLRERLREHREQILTSKHLATIVTNLDNVRLDLEFLRRRPPDRDQVKELFTTLEFKTLLERLGVEAPAPQSRGTYRTVAADALPRLLAEAARLAIAPVAGPGHPLTAELRGLAASTKTGEGAYVPVESGIPRALADLLERGDLPKLSEDAKRDRLLLEGAGLHPRGFAFDVSLASYLLDPGKRTHTLESAAWQFLGWRLGNGEAAEGDALSLGRAPEEAAAERADLTGRLAEILEARLGERELLSLYREIEMPLVDVLARMETVGVAIDVDALRALSVTLRERIDALTGEIYRLAGTEFNIGSPKQLAFVLFEKLQLPPLKRTKTGFSTDAEVLEQLAPQHEVVARILEHRELSKLLSTYVDVLPDMIDPRTGRVHTTFNQTVASTGRLVTTDPNLQNIPIRTDVGRQIRRTFVPGRPGHVLLSADYDQIELRVLAHITGDPGLLDAFRRGEDIHTVTAAEVFGVAPDGVTPEMRRQAKVFNYGIAYGISDFGLASQLGIGRAEAQRFMDTYFARYPRVQDYTRTTVELARRQGYVTTLLNRRRYLPDILSRNRVIREAAERNAINAPIQGTAADIIKIAMLRIHRDLLPGPSGLEMILQIHDELLFELPEALVPDVAPRIREIMERAYQLAAPLAVSVACGPNWQDLVDVA